MRNRLTCELFTHSFRASAGPECGGDDGAFASLLRQGDASDAGGAIANSSVALVTAGAALALPFWQTWRLQTTLFTDVPIAGWGRNQTVGFGGTLAIIRFWI